MNSATRMLARNRAIRKVLLCCRMRHSFDGEEQLYSRESGTLSFLPQIVTKTRKSRTFWFIDSDILIC
jgi:hypothetical protein